MRAHLAYKNFHPGILEVTDTFFKSKPWDGTDDQKQTKFSRWLRDACRVYGIEPVTVEFNADLSSRIGGTYHEGHLVLPKFSVTTLMHEFRHHMHRHGYVPPLDVDQNRELDAIKWSCSLFYKVRPHLFRKAVRAGGIVYVFPEDLLRRSEDEQRRDNATNN